MADQTTFSALEVSADRCKQGRVTRANSRRVRVFCWKWPPSVIKTTTVWPGDHSKAAVLGMFKDESQKQTLTLPTQSHSVPRSCKAEHSR